MSAPSVDNAAARFAGFLVALSSPEEQRLAIQIMFRDLHDAGVSRPTIVAFGDALIEYTTIICAARTATLQ